jgi:hypothetical protein
MTTHRDRLMTWTCHVSLLLATEVSPNWNAFFLYQNMYQSLHFGREAFLAVPGQWCLPSILWINLKVYFPYLVQITPNHCLRTMASCYDYSESHPSCHSEALCTLTPALISALSPAFAPSSPLTALAVWSQTLWAHFPLHLCTCWLFPLLENSSPPDIRDYQKVTPRKAEAFLLVYSSLCSKWFRTGPDTRWVLSQ